MTVKVMDNNISVALLATILSQCGSAEQLHAIGSPCHVLTEGQFPAIHELYCPPKPCRIGNKVSLEPPDGRLGKRSYKQPEWSRPKHNNTCWKCTVFHLSPNPSKPLGTDGLRHVMCDFLPCGISPHHAALPQVHPEYESSAANNIEKRGGVD